MSGSISSNSLHPHPVRFNFRRWFHKPFIQQDWGDLQDERKVSWSELFYDLFSVAATTNVTHLLINDPTAKGAGRFLLLYSVFYFVWNSHSMLVNRFHFSGLLFDVLNLLHHLGVLGMILGAQNFEWYARFAGSYAILRMVSVVYHIIIYWTIPRARTYAKLVTVHYATLVALAWVAACSSMTVFVALTIVIVALEAGAPVIPSHVPAARLPLHVDHTNERIGLIMMIYLGESIIQLGITPLANTALQYTGIAFAAIIIFCLHLIYFHNSPEQHDHAMRRSRYTGMAFHYFHVLLGASFLMAGSGLSLVLATYVPGGGGGGGHRRRTLLAAVAELAAPAAAGGDALVGAPGAEAHSPAVTDGALEHYGDGVVSSNMAWILCAGYSASLFIMSFIRMTHYLHFDKNHPIHVLGRELEMTHYLNVWWAFSCLWPFASIFIAFAAGNMGATGFLGYVCGHAIIWNLVETHITHTISSHPRWVELVMDSTHHHGSSSHGMPKSSSQGSLGATSLGASSMEMIKPNNPEDAMLASDHYAHKDADTMENGGAPEVPGAVNGGTPATAAANGGTQAAAAAAAAAANGGRAHAARVQGVAVGNDNRVHRNRSARALRHLLSKKKCEAWVDCSVL